MRKGLILVIAVTLVLFVLQAMAQVNTGTIAGTVRDISGAVIPNATVTARNVATGTTRTVSANQNGEYTIGGLQPGSYEITATAPNFAPFKGRGDVTVGGHLTVDASLNPAGGTTTVTVVAEGGTEVNTQNQELSQIVTPEQVAQLPSLTRNPYDFVAIAGNISSGDRTAQGGDQNTTSRGVGYSLNGQRESGTEILLDGVENTDVFTVAVGQQVPLDSMQEYRVITSNFDAQYGRASGGVVNVTTKSGTNDWHGGAWEFNRLSAYTANTYANAASAAPKGKYTRNQFGYALGGPIAKDKLFFFQSTEWTRVRSNAVEQAYVPTPAFLATTAPNVQAYFNAFGKNNFNFASTSNGFGLVNFVAPQRCGRRSANQHVHPRRAGGFQSEQCHTDVRPLWPAGRLQLQGCGLRQLV